MKFLVEREQRSSCRIWFGKLLVGAIMIAFWAAAPLNHASGKEEGASLWLKPLMWTNDEAEVQANQRLQEATKSKVASQWLSPMQLRADVQVPLQADEYSANEPTFEQIKRPFGWTNPQDASASKEVSKKLTDAEQIEFEKETFAWIRPFYWNNTAEPQTLPLQEEYVGTEQQQIWTAWLMPFKWKNEVPRQRTLASSNGSQLLRLPPVEDGEHRDNPQMVAFMHQVGDLPTPAGEPGAQSEALATPPAQVHNGSTSDSEDLPFVNLDEDGGLLDPDSVEGGGGAIADAETLGSEPRDNSLQFLRADTVLLEPGEMQFDYGVTYTLFDQTLPVINSSSQLELARFRQREMLVPLEVRYGLARRVQLFVNVPFGWANTELAFSDYEEFENDGGIGDLTFGGTFLLRQGNHQCPDVVMTLSASAPTAKDPLATPPGLSPIVPSLGRGSWSLAASLLYIRNYDPLVVFYGFGTRQSFDQDFNGQDFRPGQEYNYQMGIGFAVNSQITLSTRFNGAYVTEAELDGQRFLGSIQEPMAVELALTIAQCQGLVEPFVNFGLTEDAVESRIGVVWTRY